MYKNLIKDKKAIFFDLDGTIVFTNYLWSRAIGAVLDKIGINWITEESRYTPGEPLSKQWERLIKNFKINTEKNIEQLSKETNEEFLKMLVEEDLEAADGFWDFMYEMKMEKGFKVALVTNSHKETGLPILQKIKAENSFDLIIYGDEIKKPKPDPEIYNKAMEILALKPQEVLVFEDSLAGSEAARRANLEMVLIRDDEDVPEEYKGKIFFSTPDFTTFPGNMDMTYKEWVLYHAKVREENDKKNKVN